MCCLCCRQISFGNVGWGKHGPRNIAVPPPHHIKVPFFVDHGITECCSLLLLDSFETLYINARLKLSGKYVLLRLETGGTNLRSLHCRDSDCE